MLRACLPSWHTASGHDLTGVGHGHGVRVGVAVRSIVTAETTNAHARHTLGLRDGAVLVGEEERL